MNYRSSNGRSGHQNQSGRGIYGGNSSSYSSRSNNRDSRGGYGDRESSYSNRSDSRGSRDGYRSQGSSYSDRSGGRGGYRGGYRGGGGRSRRGGYGRGRRSHAAPISHDRYISKAVVTEKVPYVSNTTFDSYGFHPALQSNIKSKGYEKPTEVQEKTINLIMDGKDVLGISSTGSGKTAAFLIPAVNKMLNDNNQKLLVIAPTRELAMQIENEAYSLVRNTRLQTARVIGGESIGRQASQLRRRPQIVIGTPGRIKDMQDRRALYLADYNNIVLDEVDRMLDMGFVEEIQHIISMIADQKQSLFFSATIDPRVERIASSLASEYVSIKLSENQTAENVAQDIIKVQSYQDKIEKLHDLLNREDVQKTLIFIETKREVDKVERMLRDRGFRTEGIHGDKSQQRRKRIIQSYRNNEIRILLATNVVARGLDISDITHVVNFDEPESYDEYIHRIGRTGRNGRSGQAYTFVY